MEEAIVKKKRPNKKGTKLKSRKIEMTEDAKLICRSDMENFSIMPAKDSDIEVRFGGDLADFIPLLSPVSVKDEASEAVILEAKGTGFLLVIFGDTDF